MSLDAADVFYSTSSPLIISYHRFRKRRLYINGVPVDSSSVHRGFPSTQRPQNLSCQPFPSFCCTLVSGFTKRHHAQNTWSFN